MITTMIKVK